MNNNATENNAVLQNENSVSSTVQKKTVTTDIFDFLTLIFTVTTVFFTIHSVYNEYYGIPLAAAHTLFFIYNAAVIIVKEKKLRKEAVFPAVLLLFTTLSHGYYTFHPYLRMIFSCYLFGYFFCAQTQTRGFPLKFVADFFHQLSALFLLPVKKVFFPLRSLITNHKNPKIKKLNGVFLGIILGIPVFLVVAVLLSDSDMAFFKIFSLLFDDIFDVISELFDDYFEIITNILCTVFLSPFIYSFIFLAKHKVTKERNDSGKAEQKTKKLAFLSPAVLSGFYSVISLCYALFLFSQFTYIFSAFSGVAAYGYTLSSYARQGFFEMSAVAGINLCLIGAGAVFIKRNEKGETPRIHKVFSVFFCLFTILLIIIAAAKMGLYVSGMGLTEKRIAVLIADMVLFITFVLILIKMFRKSFPAIKISALVALSAVCLFLSFGTADIVSTFNTDMYLSGHHKKIDLHTVRLCENNYSALKNLHKIGKSSDEAIALSARDMTYDFYTDYEDFREYADEISDYLLISYCHKNDKELKEYAENYISGKKNHQFDSQSEYIYETNIEVGYISLSFAMSGNIVKIEASNSVTSSSACYSDSSPFEHGEIVTFSEWAYDPEDMLFAEITVYTKDGSKTTFHIRLDNETTTEDPEKSIQTQSTHFSGTFSIKADNSIILFSNGY